ncbi:MAG: response regulator, partial [Verrucomicrobiaceae bacterium]
HELRTPLNPVLIAASELARDPDLPERIREDARTIRRNVELEARIIDDLLDLTRITHGKLRLRTEHLDLVEAMRDVLRICNAEAESKYLQVEVEIDVQRSLVLGDGARIRQVLWNLLNNAIKFTDHGGWIFVRLLSRELSGKPAIAVEIRDTGVGIAPEALERIFHAFEQDMTHGRMFGGLGLGLAISQHIAEAHDGKLEATSSGPELGSVFTFTLPLAEPFKEHAKPLARPSGMPAPGRSLRVLLVEDHEDTRQLLVRLLSKQGHEVQAASTVAEALELAGKGEFELLISDIGLPDGTGHDVAKHVLGLRRIPAIALTGYGMDEDLRRATESGFSVHLTKPVDFSLLLKTMARILIEAGE